MPLARPESEENKLPFAFLVTYLPRFRQRLADSFALACSDVSPWSPCPTGFIDRELLLPGVAIYLGLAIFKYCLRLRFYVY